MIQIYSPIDQTKFTQNNLRKVLRTVNVRQKRFHYLYHSQVSQHLHNCVDIDCLKELTHFNIRITLNADSHMLTEKEQTQRELALNILNNI